MAVSYANRVKNEVFRGVKKERNILGAIKIRKGYWIGHILRWNCFLCTLLIQ
jgi:hypothetical protein